MFGRSKKIGEIEGRRRHRRLKAASIAVVSWGEGDSARKISGQCLDISEGGARIEITELVPPGTRVALQFPDLSAEAYGVVRHSGTGSLGVEFSQLNYFGIRRWNKPTSVRGKRNFFVAAAMALVLVAVILYTVPGLLPTWVPFSPHWARRVSSTAVSFTLGSSKAVVLAVQGPPMRMTDTVWHYGPSRVFFRGGVVSGWSVSPGTPLRTGVSKPDESSSERKRFAVGSTASEVLDAQGAPTEMTDEVWRYGLSEVYFKGGRVVKWKETPGRPLSVEPGQPARKGSPPPRPPSP